MLRKLTLATVAALGLMSPLAVTQANAREYHHEYRPAHRNVHAYGVYFRDSCNHGWSFGSTFANRREAERYAESYRCRGFEISIR